MTETNKRSDSCDENKITASDLVNRITRREQVINDLSCTWPLGEDTLERLQRNFARRLTAIAWSLGLPAGLPNDKKMFRILAYAVLNPRHYINSPTDYIAQKLKQQDVLLERSDEEFDALLADAKDTFIPWRSEDRALLGEVVRNAMLID